MSPDPGVVRRPLDGIKVIDMSAQGPGPFCSMLLADYGADVIEIVRPDPEPFDPAPMFARGKRSVVVDIRADGGPEIIRRLVANADVFLESYRPGTMERRGLGPDVLMADNPRLVYTRLTGYGQSGPYSGRAGHDINYIAIGGGLGVIGTSDPVPPLNIVGDFAGGSMNAALGVLLALFERERTGLGQTVDAAMVDGVTLLVAAQIAYHAMGEWPGRGRSTLSGNAPHYGAYLCSDRKWFAVGAIEARFYSQMLGALGLDPAMLADRDDPDRWPELRARFAEVFASEPRDHWTTVFGEIDGCGTPVLEIDELLDDPHLRERGTIGMHDGRVQPAPAPRLSRGRLPVRSRPDGRQTREVLLDCGFAETDISSFAARGALPDLVSV